MQDGGLNQEETRLLHLVAELQNMPPLIRMRPSEKLKYKQITVELMGFYQTKTCKEKDDFEHCIEFFNFVKHLSEVGLTRRTS